MLGVDVVSGATYSSNGIIKAVKNALTGEEDNHLQKGGSSNAGVVAADESEQAKMVHLLEQHLIPNVKVSVTIKKNKINQLKFLKIDRCSVF